MTNEDFERRGPAARAKREGRSYGVRLKANAFTVRIDEDGRPKTPVAPFGAVEGACRLCPSRCCHLKVTVSLPDAVRYSRVLRVPIFSGLTVVASEHADHSFRLDADERFGHDAEWSGRAELALQRTEEGHCHALIKMGGYRRCGAYEARPSFCRTYPALWASDVAEGGPISIRCPVPYGITDADADAFVHDIEQSIEEWELHDDVVAAWNDSSGPFTLEAFVEFAIPRTARALGVDVPDGLAAGTAEERLHFAMIETGQTKRIPGLPIVQPSSTAGLPPRGSKPTGS